MATHACVVCESGGLVVMCDHEPPLHFRWPDRFAASPTKEGIDAYLSRLLSEVDGRLLADFERVLTDCIRRFGMERTCALLAKLRTRHHAMTSLADEMSRLADEFAKTQRASWVP